MSGKRKDSRGRVLRNGEIQESNGRYRYKYVDSFGESKYVRSWRFVKEDSHFCKYYDGIYILFITGLRISEFAPFAQQNTLKYIKFCDKNKKNSSSKNNGKASKYKEIGVFTKMIKILFVCHGRGLTEWT